MLLALRVDLSREHTIRDEYFPRLVLAGQARTAMFDQQASMRGFIISGDERFLESFLAGRASYVAARDELLTFDSRGDDVDALRDRQFAIAEDWYQTIALPQNDARRSSMQPELTQQAILEGQALVDDFRLQNDGYQDALRDEIDGAVDDVNTIQNTLFAGAIASGLTVLALTVWISVWLIRSLSLPLTAIGNVASAVNRGDTDRRIGTLSAIEFDRLGQNVNQMLDSLAVTVTEANLHRRRTTAIVDSASEGIVVVDGLGNVTTINPTAARMFDTFVDSARHQPAADLGFFTLQEIDDIIEQPHSGGVQPVVRRHGERVLSAAVSTLQGNDGETSSGLVWLLRDVTELAQIDEMKSEFIAIVSHELRTPLTAIKGFTDLILEGDVGDISEQQREFLEIVQSNSDRLVSLINDMLDISRIEAGRVVLNREEVDISAAIKQAVAALRPLIDDKHLQVQTELVEGPSGVIADRARLQQILTNLISNACKYTLDGGWITVRSEALDGQIALSVSDTGIGIPPDALPHIFSRFYRVDQAQSRDIGGTGLGLAITKSLVEIHGGKIAIGSRAGVGTTVRFTLPAPGPADIRRDGFPFDGSGQSPLVLIVSGDIVERAAWEASLRGMPSHVVIARGTTAAAAIAEVELHRPSVIVGRCGTGPGQLNLDELREELQASPELRHTPVVAVVASVIEDGVPSNVTLVTSDIAPHELADVIREMLRDSAEVRPRRGRVLVAEDDVDMANWLRQVLVRNGFEVVLVRDGLAAIVRAVEILPDAVILDVNMPRMGAVEVLPQLLSNPGTREIPIVVMSGTVPDSGPYFIDAGAADFFSKPFNGDLLVRRLIQLTRKTQDG